MKNATFRALFMALFSIGLFFTSCSSETTSTDTNTEQTGKEYTSAYICPMHCEGSGSETAGACPVCGMDYEKNEGHSHGEGEHDHAH